MFGVIVTLLPLRKGKNSIDVYAFQSGLFSNANF